MRHCQPVLLSLSWTRSSCFDCSLARPLPACQMRRGLLDCSRLAGRLTVLRVGRRHGCRLGSAQMLLLRIDDDGFKQESYRRCGRFQIDAGKRGAGNGLHAQLSVQSECKVSIV